MSYRLNNGEPLSSGIQRIVTEQIDRALEQINDPDDPDAVVHDVRKRMKKIRGALRLVRDEIGEEIYQRENVRFRDVGRRLAPVRETRVAVETLDLVREQFGDQLAGGAFDGARNILTSYHRDVRERTLEDEKALDEVAARLQKARDRVSTWPIKHERFRGVRDGLKRVYKRGRKAMAAAYADPAPENFHEWRKRVKYLWYHTRILRNVWPAVMGEMGDEIHRLSDDLGDVHDLVDLHSRIFAHPEVFTEESEKVAFVALLNRRRAELETAARPLGQRIYTEKPKRFTKRIGRYWKVWQAQHQPTTI